LIQKMQKIGVFAAAVLATSTDAYRMNRMSSSPFEGEHKDAHVIEGENKTTHRAMMVP